MFVSVEVGLGWVPFQPFFAYCIIASYDLIVEGEISRTMMDDEIGLGRNRRYERSATY